MSPLSIIASFSNKINYEILANFGHLLWQDGYFLSLQLREQNEFKEEHAHYGDFRGTPRWWIECLIDFNISEFQFRA